MFGLSLLAACSFLRGSLSGDKGGRGDLKRTKEGETVVMIYCIRKEYIFNKDIK